MNYRKEIDGLRAVAVIPVILFHLGIAGFSGGFLGVDVFFVISGYLITSILLQEKESGKFSLFKFYDRRARRILPALLLTIALSSIAAWFIMMPSQLKDFGQSSIASIGFMANMYFWLKLNYWSQSAELIPLLHIWSLGIEEQFYLIFPFLLLLLGARKILGSAVIVIALASYIAMCYVYNLGKVSEAFYLLPFRAWELAVGCIAAVYFSQINQLLAQNYKKALSILGALLLIASLMFFDKHTHFALLHLVPVIAAVLIILFATQSDFVGRLLSIKPLVIIGLLSYSLYLFHQPVLAFARLYTNEAMSYLTQTACLIFITLLAALSYRFIETPCRNQKRISALWFYSLMLVIVLILAGFAAAAHKTNGFMNYKLANLPEQEAALIKSLTEERRAREKLWEELLKDSRMPFSNDGRKRVLVIGDSISEDMFVSVQINQELGKIAEFRRLPLDEGCMKSKGSSGVGMAYPTCKEELDAFLHSEVLAQADYILLANSWLPATVSGLTNFIEFIEPYDIKLIVYKLPQFQDMTSILMGAGRFSHDMNSLGAKRFYYNSLHERTLMANVQLLVLTERYNLPTIDGLSYFCEVSKTQCSLFDRDSVPRLMDNFHFTKTGVEEFSPWLAKELQIAIKAHE